ncbi:MAG: alpha/beta fold hydrolase [Proteobacteria bacterium]|nr:alpha/beta fold hydrolase [Pseudomonadota bacterium]
MKKKHLFKKHSSQQFCGTCRDIITIRDYIKRKHHHHACYVYIPKHIPQAKRLAPVVFLHGLGCDSAYLLWPLRTTLLHEGIPFISVDLEGHGVESEGYFVMDHARKPHSDEAFLPQLAEFLRSRFSVASFHLIGYSLGAVVAFNAASQSPPPSYVISLSLLAPPWQHQLGVFPLLSESLVLLSKPLVSYLKYFGLKAVLPAFGSMGRKRFPLRVRGKYSRKAMMDWIDKQPLCDYMDAYIKNSQKGSSSLPSLSIPILWLQGKYDRIIPPLPVSVFSSLRSSSTETSTAASFDYHLIATTHLGMLIHDTMMDYVIAHMKRWDRQRLKV